MLYEVVVRHPGPEASPEGTVFRTIVETDAVDAAAIEGLQAMRRELVGPLQGSKLVVEIAAMGPERAG